MINAEGCLNGVGFLLYLAGLGMAAKWPTLHSCSRYWLKMTDANYKRVIERYKTCIELISLASGNESEMYRKFVSQNLVRSSDLFFQTTSLPTPRVVGALKIVAKMMDALDENGTEVATGKSCRHCCTEQQLVLSGFVFLICAQILLLALLFYRICCTNDISPEEECDNRCMERKCGDVISCASALNHAEKKHWKHHCPSWENGTHCGKTRLNENILSDFSSLPTSRVGSDSEFEALIKTRRLPKASKKPKKKTPRK